MAKDSEEGICQEQSKEEKQILHHYSGRTTRRFKNNSKNFGSTKKYISVHFNY